MIPTWPLRSVCLAQGNRGALSYRIICSAALMNKSQLRKKLLHYRRTLTKDEIKIASEACCIQLLQLKSVQASQNIAVYLSINHEIDLTFFINEALNKKKTLYLPCLDNQHLILR